MMAACDEGSRLSEESYLAIESLGSNEIRNLGFRDSWAMITIKGKGECIAEKYAEGYSSCIDEATVPLPESSDSTAPSGILPVDGILTSSDYSVDLNLTGLYDGESGLGANAQVSFSNDLVNWSIPQPISNFLPWNIRRDSIPVGYSVMRRKSRFVFVRIADAAGNWSKPMLQRTNLIDKASLYQGDVH